MNVTHTVEVITPELAADYLTKTLKHKRTVREGRVLQYARDMQSGEWELNGEAIKFNGNGRLYDGVHRLTACSRAGVPFVTFVVRGLDENTIRTLDTGAARNLGDILKLSGYKDTATLSATIRFCWRYDRKLMQSNRGITLSPTEALHYLENNPGLLTATSVGSSLNKAGIRFTRSVSSGIYHLIARESDRAKLAADEFFGHLRLGTHLSEGDPVFALRRWAERQMTQPHGKPLSEQQAAVIIKAFNYWVADRPIELIRWRQFGSQREPFPTLALELIA